jgi:hypothetical protein
MSKKNRPRGGAITVGPGRTTHRGGHGRELRAAKKTARQAARVQIRRVLEGRDES